VGVDLELRGRPHHTPCLTAKYARDAMRLLQVLVHTLGSFQQVQELSSSPEGFAIHLHILQKYDLLVAITQCIS
jgi:hypothetical protein